MSDRGVVGGGQNGRRERCRSRSTWARCRSTRLVKLLSDIERSPGLVRVRRLRLRKSFENKDMLDVSLTVSAWQGLMAPEIAFLTRHPVLRRLLLPAGACSRSSYSWC